MININKYMKIIKVNLFTIKAIMRYDKTSLNVAAIKCIVHLLQEKKVYLAGKSLFIEYTFWQDVSGCLGFLIAYNTLCIY